MGQKNSLDGRYHVVCKSPARGIRVHKVKGRQMLQVGAQKHASPDRVRVIFLCSMMAPLIVKLVKGRWRLVAWG